MGCGTLWYIPSCGRQRIIWLLSLFFFFLRHLDTDAHNFYINLHSHQQWINISPTPYLQPAFVVFYFPDNSQLFQCGKIDFKVLLVFIFPMDVQHPLCICVCVFRTVFLISLMICSFSFSGLFLSSLYVLDIDSTICRANTSSPILWLSVHSAGSFLCCAEVS